jgi:RHS repeat-associated protein
VRLTAAASPPYGSGDAPISQTARGFTGQRLDDSGLMHYNARLYDPALGRFVSADTIVPGSASGSMQGVAAKPLTVAFHETGFLGKLNQESGAPFWFQLGRDGRKQLGSPFGPVNPQALNRYSYVLNNPVKYTDPSGHAWPGEEARIPGGGGYEQVCADENGGHVACKSAAAVGPAQDDEGNLLYYVFWGAEKKLVSSGDPFFAPFKDAIDAVNAAIIAFAIAAGVLPATVVAAVAVCFAGTLAPPALALCLTLTLAVLAEATAVATAVIAIVSGVTRAGANFPLLRDVDRDNTSIKRHVVFQRRGHIPRNRTSPSGFFIRTR